MMLEKLDGKIDTIPEIERGFIDIERQKEIISELYSYLLKKKEETAISLAVTVSNAKIIDKAYSSNDSGFTKKANYLYWSFFDWTILPFTFFYINELLDTKIYSRKDVEEFTTIPYMGDVPHSETDEKIVISNDSRTSTAESFRLIRTNLGFYASE